MKDAITTPANTLGGLAQLLLHGEVEVIDCTQVLGPDTPLQSYPDGFAKNPPDIEINKISEYDEDGPFFAWNWLVLGEHSGTHLAAPRAWISGRDHSDGTTDALDVQKLSAPACVIDCSAEAAEDASFRLSKEHITAWEDTHGEIAPGSWVILRTDWDKRLPDKAAFLNNSTHPGPTADAITYLISKNIVGFGSQCVSVDTGDAQGATPPWPARHKLAEANCFALTSLTYMDRLPPKGAILVAAPLKFDAGTGAPVRALALVPRGNGAP